MQQKNKSLTNCKTIALILFASAFAAGCTPAKIASIPKTAEADKAELLVYREPAFNSSGVSLIFGANSSDYVKLRNRHYAKFDLKSGSYQFYVRGDQADKPYLLAIKLQPKDRKCLKAFANPANYAKALAPITFFFSHSFLLEKVDCPTKEQLSNYSLVPVRYTDS